MLPEAQGWPNRDYSPRTGMRQTTLIVLQRFGMNKTIHNRWALAMQFPDGLATPPLGLEHTDADHLRHCINIGQVFGL